MRASGLAWRQEAAEGGEADGAGDQADRFDSERRDESLTAGGDDAGDEVGNR